MVLAPRSLPGIRIDVAPPPVADALPRMDVAVFAGFAATGPLHVPVLITSAPHFFTVFGRDAPLAWDAQRGELVRAYLGAAVRGFFANGGRRCWVIRVARNEALQSVRRALRPLEPERAVATANLFPVAGVLEIASNGNAAPAVVRARSEGSWSDEMRLATANQQRTIGITDLTIAVDGRCEFRARRRIEPGELIEFRDGALRAFAVVGSVAVETAEVAAPYRVAARLCASFEQLEFGTSSPLVPLTGEVSGSAFDATPATLAAEGNDFAELSFTVAAPLVPRTTQWLRFTAGGDTFWLQARAVTQRSASSASPGGGALTHSDVVVFGPAWRQLEPLPSFSTDRVFCSTLELRAENRGDDELARLAAVGLTPSAANPWWRQTTDEQAYRVALDTRPDTLAGPEGQVAPFPFAPLAGAAPVAWIPLAVDALFNDGLPPLPSDASALERDGLADFDASLFLDPELEHLATAEVIVRGESIRFLRDEPRALFGIHAALAIGSGGLSGECSLLSVPDAVHVGWQQYAADEPPAAEPRPARTPAHWSTHRGACAPAASEPMAEPDFGTFLDCATRLIPAPELVGPDAVGSLPYQLQWTMAEPDAEYVLTESQQSDLSDARTIYTGDLTQYSIETPRDGIFYYRVFARAGEERSADSNIVTVQVRTSQWRQIEADQFAIEGEPELLRLHRAMLRFAASSGELFAILALPRHYRTPQALRYAGRLRTLNDSGAPADSDGLALFESRTLSYGALYHPWLVSASRPPANLALGSTVSESKILPPDGTIAGAFAARATLRGAWVAPANEPLLGVVAMTPEIESDDWQSLQDAAVNVIREDARGFITLSADTLIDDRDLRLINVRRLLILLRRLALRRGNRYVFEPNGPTLRRAVQRGFDTLLTDMFRRGAFSGRTPEQSFRVVTDDTVNTRIDADAGRFIVELRVAPSMPMRFLSLLLSQTGERLTVTEEL